MLDVYNVEDGVITDAGCPQFFKLQVIGSQPQHQLL